MADKYGFSRYRSHSVPLFALPHDDFDLKNMKTRLVNFALITLSASVFIEAARANLVANGDLTQVKEGTVSDWVEKSVKKPNSIPLQGTIRSENDEEISLSKEAGPISALKIESKGEDGGGCLLSQPTFPLLAGFEYEVSFRYRSQGLIPESMDRKTMVGIICDLFMENDKGRVSSVRLLTMNNSEGWVTLSKRFMVPAEVTKGQIRLSLSNRFPGSKATVWLTDIKVEPLDPTLPNASFEKGSAPDKVEGWKSQGGGKSVWSTAIAHTGKASVSVSEAPDGMFSGWVTDIPVRSDRAYSLTGYVKTGILNPNGRIGGGAVSIQFLGAEGQPLGKPIISRAIGANADWTKVATEKTQPPVGATSARMMAMLQYAHGTAWYDDLSLDIEPVESKKMERIKRQSAAPSRSVTYAVNLLSNGDLEKGNGDNPAGWTYVGKSAPDWTDAEIAEFHTKGRPQVSLGRGQGIWEHGMVYSGKGALLNVSIDPPLSKHSQWYGRNAVDGYWLSDPMPCNADEKYIATAWIRPGAAIDGHWFGPLELRFYDKSGKQILQKEAPRSPIGSFPAGAWNYCPTQPYQAPAGAATMRLRFGQELSADKGGWGRSCGDNFAVWKLEESVPLTDYKNMTGNSSQFWPWFRQATEKVKPPYLSAPLDAAEYDTVCGKLDNSTLGNIYAQPDASLKVKFSLLSLLGEDRSGLSMKIVRYDAKGKESQPIVVTGISLPGGGTTTVEATLPPTHSFGAFYLDAAIYEGMAKVGSANGRYAVLPPLKRPHTSENIFGVTLLDTGDHKLSYSKERQHDVGAILKMAGFGIHWERYYFDVHNEAVSRERLKDLKEKIAWFTSLGIRTFVQVAPSQGATHENPSDIYDAYKNAGKLVAKELKDLVVGFGDWGIEQVNSGSPYRGGGKDRWTDEEYDTVMLAIYEGIKEEDPKALVMTGNIATDIEGKSVQRLYGAPVKGHFDGAVLNAYMGILAVCQKQLQVFDEHGDKHKVILQEESAVQRSPYEGEARRYGEIQGAEEMARTDLTLIGKLSPRIKAVTYWSFSRPMEEDRMMVTPSLQPRPQFVAHAVMSDALADATFVADRSKAAISLFEWKRPSLETPGQNESLMAGWSNTDRSSVTLEVPAGTLKVMDLFGNTREIKPVNGLVTVELTQSPSYFIGASGLAVSKRMELQLKHAETQPGENRVELVLKNNDSAPVEGEIIWSAGEKDDLKKKALTRFSVQPGETVEFPQIMEGEFIPGKKVLVNAEVKTTIGSVFAATLSLNFAQAVLVSKPPALDGTWDDWKSSVVIPFGVLPSEITQGRIPGDEYSGPDDLLGNLRLMWDEKNLYLGVEALDNKMVRQPERGEQGFMADSIEFGIQPDGIYSSDAPIWVNQVYLPDDGQDKFAASRSMPAPRQDMSHWMGRVKPTGVRGNMNYQVAIPWKDIGVNEPQLGKTFSISVVLNDADIPGRIGGGRKRIHWFNGVDSAKNPMGFGDVTLVK